LRYYRYDTSGEIPSRVSFVLALTAVALVFLAPLLPERVGDRETGERVSVVTREGLDAGGAALGLTFVSAVPFLLRRGAPFKLAQRLSAAVLVVGVLVTLTSVGVLYGPSAALMVLAATRRPPPDPFR